MSINGRVKTLMKVIYYTCNSWANIKCLINSLVTQKHMTKFLSANFQKHVKSKLYQIENSKTSGPKSV